ncbi:hypothetical protein H4219_003644 [Mycoemilia scoparia]|uniref:Uncharacterized protein n=1 Tax=Mycoemilia scoparia TaxID=417184 RepID=A0A9W7ZUF5_9FUNG|nr:hypothetical protein H4219_003644 [Mycoemilia scoparia]
MSAVIVHGQADGNGKNPDDGVKDASSSGDSNEGSNNSIEGIVNIMSSGGSDTGCGDLDTSDDELVGIVYDEGLSDFSSICGKKACITSTKYKPTNITVTLVGPCVFCKKGGLEISRAAIEQLNDGMLTGGIEVSWRYC